MPLATNTNGKESEFTIRSVILAIFLTAILAASNVYLALKLGHTIAASIPAAVLSLTILRFFKNSNILESNLVQTSASAGEGVAAAVSFILPAFIITGFWSHFYYWQTVLLVFIGGSLGLFFSVPLRRILINHKDLLFPEGTAIGHVLKVSLTERAQFFNLITGGLLGALISILQTGLKVISESWQLWFMNNRLLFGTSLGFSPALLAAGFIVGIQASIGLFIGFFLCWVIGIPILSLNYPSPDLSPYAFAMKLWSEHIRFIGVGAMLTGGCWTLLIMIKPIMQGLRLSFLSINLLNQKQDEAHERDLPFQYVLFGILIFTILSLVCFFYFLSNPTFGFTLLMRVVLSLLGTSFVILIGFFLASICGYLSGLVGMTNNPLSGLMLISVLLISLILSLSFFKYSEFANIEITFAILITAIIAIITAISGETIQDLKAGQIVGATPWKQQVMIMLGVVVAAFVVQPILELLFQAYGIGGVFPKPLMNPSQMLPAPQAGLMTAVAQGVFKHSLPSLEIGIGALIAMVGVVIDESIKKYNLRFPIMAIGLGIYLPPDIILPVVIGGFLNYFVKRKHRSSNGFENGTLSACGIVAGSALTGVILAIPFVIAGNSDVLKILPDKYILFANLMGIISVVFLCAWLYFVSNNKTPNT